MQQQQKHFWETPCHKQLVQAARDGPGARRHLREALKDAQRCAALCVEATTPMGEVVLDFSRQKLDADVLKQLLALAREQKVEEAIKAMFAGEKINQTENRSVLHTALRATSEDAKIVGHKVTGDGPDGVVGEVQKLLSQIAEFSGSVRSGKWKGQSGKTLTDVICVGIGGSYLGPEFVYEALRTYPACAKDAEGRRLRFLANVDPIDIARATENFCPETTLVVVISKTFTTAETMLNATTLREWIVNHFNGDAAAVAKHMVAVSTNLPAVEKFGISAKNAFGFWDWVGGRFSVCSAVGALPLALHFGPRHVRDFLDGCRWMDQHFQSAPLERNLPVLMGLIGVWNSTYLNHGAVAVLPYCQALVRFAAHIQQLTMESNGKRVTQDGAELPVDAGELFFGEPGTNGQHSFYQLLHQGRVVPAEFIGFAKSQVDIVCRESPVSNHDELMSNFFAQPDALAVGKTPEQLKAENCPSHLMAHKTFPGDRPSSSLLMPVCSPFFAGVLLALYEHRTAVQGFVWGINSFDQWGVELGKVLAKNVRQVLRAKRHIGGAASAPEEDALVYSTRKLIEKYLQL